MLSTRAARCPPWTRRLGSARLAVAARPRPIARSVPGARAGADGGGARASARATGAPQARHGLWVPCEGSVRVLDDAARIPRADRRRARARHHGSLRAGVSRRPRLVRVVDRRRDAAPQGARAQRRRRPFAAAARRRPRERAARPRLDERALALGEPQRDDPRAARSRRGAGRPARAFGTQLSGSRGAPARSRLLPDGHAPGLARSGRAERARHAGRGRQPNW